MPLLTRLLPTPLETSLKKLITFNGPLTLASYMRECLTHPTHGYYTTRPTIFGRHGDFITAPQISQVFGELLAVWISHLARQSPAPFRLAELGGGDARLMTDILRTLTRLQTPPSSISLLEASPSLRALQTSSLSPFNLPVTLHPSVDDIVSTSVRTIFLAQEFLDALPVHVFQRETHNAPFRERMVSFSDAGLRFVVSDARTPACSLLQAVTPRGLVEEVGGEGLAIVETISKHVADHHGAFLIIDYGSREVAGDTLRAVGDHEILHVLSRPGEVDVTADVNFGHVAETVGKVKGVKYMGCVTQREFLLGMGAAERFRALARGVVQKGGKDDVVDRKLEGLQEGYERLVGQGAEGMGDVYRVAAVVPSAVEIVAAF